MQLGGADTRRESGRAEMAGAPARLRGRRPAVPHAVGRARVWTLVARDAGWFVAASGAGMKLGGVNE